MITGKRKRRFIETNEDAFVMVEDSHVSEAFCPTGKDGGVDNSCPPNRDNGTSSSSAASPAVNPKVESWAKEKFGDESKAKAFAKWFGDSKVVDEDGKPLVVYHGTQSRFDEFKSDTTNAWSDTLGFDTYFHSESRATASTYANQFDDGVIMESYLSIQNPLVIDAKGGEWVDALSEVSGAIRTYRTPEEKNWLDTSSAFNEKYGYELDSDPESIPQDEMSKLNRTHREFQMHIIDNRQQYETAKRKPYGYDGIIVKNVLDNTAADPDSESGGYSPFTTVYVAFRPTQIKSATGNKGTFSPDSPKITEAFCPTGEGGGVDNSCGSGDRPTTSGRTSQPKGFRSLDDAIKLAGLDSETSDKSKSDTKPAEPKIRTVVRNESDVSDWLQRLDIPKVDRQVLSQSAGALEGSTVVMMGGRGGVHMEVHDDRYRAVTSVQRSAEGDLYLENWNFQVFPHERGRGLGTEIIKTQIDAAHQMGARGIVVHSIGDWKRRDTHNGYYTWPRMGFDGDLPRDWQSRMMATGLAEIPEQFSQASRVSDFFKKPEGRELWKRHGFPMELAFDVQPGSLSRKVFDNYYSAQTRRQAEIKQEEDDTEQARAERWRRMEAAMKEFDAKAGESAVTKPPENHNSFDLGVDDDESVYGEAWDALSGLATESSSENLVPPESVRSNAKRGLELRAKNGGKGGTIVGVARARDLSNGSSLSPRTIGRMVSFFARHQGNQEGGEQDEGYIAWLLWGGDAGKRWANARWEEIQRARG